MSASSTAFRILIFSVVLSLFILAGCSKPDKDGGAAPDQGGDQASEHADDQPDGQAGGQTGNSLCVPPIKTLRCQVLALDERLTLAEELIANTGLMSAGNGTQQLAAALIAGGKTPVRISAGWGHSMAVVDDGTVWAWGSNNNGFLGDGSMLPRPRPVPVLNLADVAEISAGSSHSLARSVRGAVYAWGDNDNGQLGLGTQQSSTVPVNPLSLPAQATQVDAGWFRSFSNRGGIGRAWGNNQNGELGVNNSINQLAPAPILNLNNIRAISGGKWHTLALLTDGDVWAWGSNPNGLLGIEDPNVVSSNEYVPVKIPSLANVTAISAGWEHNLALKGDGTVWAWGKNDLGQLGIPPINTDRPVPTQVPGLSNIQSISAGGDFSLALHANGTVSAWGGNYFGQLGDGGTQARVTPAVIPNLTNVMLLDAGVNHALVLEGNNCNIVWAWGLNGAGQLGDGGTHEKKSNLDYSPRPVPVALGNGVFNAFFPPSGQASTQCRLFKLDKIGDGLATITVNPGNHQCDNACRGLFLRFTGNTQITVSAQIDPVTQFNGWGSACTSLGTSVSGNVIVDRSKRCTFDSTLVVAPE